MNQIWTFGNKPFDPTKVTFLYPPEWQHNYEDELFRLNEKSIEIFTSLIFNWILNVSQILDAWGKKRISIPINPEFVDEKLSFLEILSDIVLYQLITWEDDRWIHLTNDKRTKNWEYIKSHNCIIFSKGTYSIFDIYKFIHKIPKDEVFKKIFLNIRELYSNDFFTRDDFYFLLCAWFDDEIWKNNFFWRMLLKVNEFLERYDWDEWKKFFLRQKAHSVNSDWMPSQLNEKEDFWYDKDEEEYENLIFTLKNIKEVISQDDMKEVAMEYLYSDFNFVKNDLVLHLKKSGELLLQLITAAIPKKVKNILLNLVK